MGAKKEAQDKKNVEVRGRLAQMSPSGGHSLLSRRGALEDVHKIGMSIP